MTKSSGPECDVTVVLTTVGTMEQGEALAAALIERKLAACVNIVDGVCSVYRWKGELTREAERLLVIKTTAARTGELREAIVELHSYEVPEVLVLPVGGGHAPYLDWVRAETAQR